MITIRSQDKETIIEVKRLEVENIGTSDKPKWAILGNSWILGEYPTKERAMEVLDDIQIAIEKQLKVFQMPEE